MISKNGYLFIEPTGKTSEAPVIDQLTKKMMAALAAAKPKPRYGGAHVCRCGAESSGYDYHLPDRGRTHSLAVHYLAWHRAEIPPEELEKVAALPYGERELPPRMAAKVIRGEPWI